jgi:Bax protein
MKNKLAIFYIIISIAFTFYLVLTSESTYKNGKLEVAQEVGIEKLYWDYIYYKDWKNLDNFFEQINYSLDKKIVPNVIVKKFPDNLNDITDINKKKDIFVKIMLPIINKVNYNIEKERANILNGNIDEKITQKYASTDKDILLRRVQPIPVHIALGQSAKESGWGTSRFAIEGNNIFGEWTWEEGAGIVPAGRPEGETYEVKKFDSLVESMESYALKLNTLDYYSDFRKIRNGEIKNKRLTEGLLYYSQQREAYVESLSNLIDSNNFKKYNDYNLVNE